MDTTPVSRDEFEVALICALPLEADAVYLLFDEFFPNDYQKVAGDPNHYTTGRIGNKNVVLVLLSGMGKVYAASAAASLNASFTNLRLGIVIGICGGVPGRNKDEEEIVLGDVVISNAMIQFDFGRRYPGGSFSRKFSIHEKFSMLSKDIRSVLRSIETIRGRADLELRTAHLLADLQNAYRRDDRRRKNEKKYTYPGSRNDILFESTYRHRHRGPGYSCCTETETCDDALQDSCESCGCERGKIILRSEQFDSRKKSEQGDAPETQDPVIHIGPIASGDTVMKSGEDRDRISKEDGVIAFEMEGAGFWDEMPCIIIKGVCDYADSHKHKLWQNFAAATSAAATKALLEAIPDIKRPSDGTEMVSMDPPVPADFKLPHELQLVAMLFKLQQQNSICPQMPLNPILVIDARGRYLPFHLETISSKELFMQVLKSKFADLGTTKIERGEWFLEDQSTRRRLDLSKPWQTIIKPNQILKMSMVFRRKNQKSSECPSCGFMNAGLTTDEINCHCCGLIYRRVEEVQNIQIDSTADENAKSNAPAEHIGPSPPLQRPPEYDISRYKHVQLVDVNFNIGLTEKGGHGHTRSLRLHGEDLKNAKRLAHELASIYGLSEEDSINLATSAVDSLPIALGLLEKFSGQDVASTDSPNDRFRAAPLLAWESSESSVYESHDDGGYESADEIFVNAHSYKTRSGSRQLLPYEITADELRQMDKTQTKKGSTARRGLWGRLFGGSKLSSIGY